MTGFLRRLAAFVPDLPGPAPVTPASNPAARAAHPEVVSASSPRAVAGPRGRSRRFGRPRGGASAVEFALVAAPFLALFCVVAESGLVALEQQTLDTALDRGVRQLRTGIFQEGADGSDPGQRFRKIVCSGPSVLFPCTDLRLDVSRTVSFSTSQPAEPFDKTKKTWAAGFGMRFDCRIMSDKSQMLIATEIFQAEDYEPKPC